METSPYRTAGQTIRGAVIEFVKTAAPAALSPAEEVPPLAQEVLSVMRQPVLLLDPRLHLTWANRALFETYAVTPAALGEPFAEAWGSRSDPPELWAMLQDALAGKPAHELVVDKPFGRAAGEPVRISARRVTGDGQTGLVAVLFEKA